MLEAEKNWMSVRKGKKAEVMEGGVSLEYSEYMVQPEELEFERADAEQQRVLRMINERDKAAIILALVMGTLTGIVAVVMLFKFVGLIGGIAAIAVTILLIAGLCWYLAKVFPQKGYQDFEILPMEVVTTNYRTGELRAVDLWSEEQQKCVKYNLVRGSNHIVKGGKGLFVRAISDQRKDYIFVTEYDYKIMKMNADNRTSS